MKINQIGVKIPAGLDRIDAYAYRKGFENPSDSPEDWEFKSSSRYGAAFMRGRMDALQNSSEIDENGLSDRRQDNHRDFYKNAPWRKDAAPSNSPPSNPDYPTMPFNKDEWMKSATREDQSDIPVVGGTIRTMSAGTEGKVVKIVGDEIFYTIADGRMMKSPLHRVVPVEKLEDGSEELCEISNEVLARYKSAAGKDASAADARGDFKKGDKRFSGIVKATKKQFDNDAKARQAKESGCGGVSGAVAVEGTMTGINRSAPAQDVSYERMLDDDVINELKVDTMRNFNNKVSSTDRFRTASGLQLVKDKEGKERALRKIAAKTGDRTRDLEKVRRGTYEERLAEFLELDETLGDDEKIAAMKKWAMDNYENGADTFVEAYGNEELAELLAQNGGDLDKTLEFMARLASVWAERQADANYYSRGEVDEAFKDEFADLINKQYKEEPPKPKKSDVQKVRSKNENFMIWFRPQTDNLTPVKWQVRDKNDDMVLSGSSSNEKDAYNDAENAIVKSQEVSAASKSLTLNYNAAFAREFGGDGQTVWVDFDTGPTMNYSTEPQEGYKRTVIRTPEHSRTAGAALLPVTTMSPSEANKIGLKANSRYTLGRRLELDADKGIYGFELQWHSRIEKGQPVPLKEPAITVSETDKVKEEYRGPHLGDAEKLAKAPKSTMQGSDNVRFSQLVQDSIKEHGLKWAFEYYVKKHGLPPRQFQIYAGLAAKPKAVAPAKSEWTDPSRTKRSPAKKSLLQRLRGMLPFEE